MNVSNCDSDWLNEQQTTWCAGIAGRTLRTWRRNGLSMSKRDGGWQVKWSDLFDWMVEHKPYCFIGSKGHFRRPRLTHDSGIVYALVDPKGKRVCYIGQSVIGLRRVRNHLSELRAGKHCNDRLQKLFTARVRDGFGELSYRVLDTALGIGLNALECDWIARGRKLGWPLCNATDGGEGVDFTPATRQKLTEISKAKWADPEYQRRHEASVARRKGMTVEQYRAWAQQRAEKRVADLARHHENMAKAAARKAVEQTKDRRPFVVVPLTHKGTAFLPLTQGKWARVDASDWERVNTRRWAAQPKRGRWRAKNNQPPYLLSRFVLDAREGEQVAVLNGNALDCRRSNLSTDTAASRSQHKRRGAATVDAVLHRRRTYEGMLRSPAFKRGWEEIEAKCAILA